MRRSWIIGSLVAICALKAWAQDTGDASSVAPAASSEVLELGGSDNRVCPSLSVTPEAYFNELALAAEKVGADRVPYRSCGGDCQSKEPYKTRLSTLAALGLAGAGNIAVGKATRKELHQLANALLSGGRESEWNDLAGMDCNGFTGRFIEANGWKGWGADPKNNYPPHMANLAKTLGISPLTSTDQICPGDLVVYSGASHIELVGDRAGTTTLNGRELALFNMYESVKDGKLDGTYTSVQGIDITGGAGGAFRLEHLNQKGLRASEWNNVVIYPGPGKI